MVHAWVSSNISTNTHSTILFNSAAKSVTTIVIVLKKCSEGLKEIDIIKLQNLMKELGRSIKRKADMLVVPVSFKEGTKPLHQNTHEERKPKHRNAYMNLDVMYARKTLRIEKGNL